MFSQGIVPSNAVRLQEKSGTRAKDTAVRGITGSFGEVGTAKNYLPVQ